MFRVCRKVLLQVYKEGKRRCKRLKSEEFKIVLEEGSF